MTALRVVMRAALGRRLPTISGTMRVPGLAGGVTIRRDRFGVPHVDATTDGDAWFGLGFCQGQDRTFQLETRLRLCRGTLSALVGPEALPIDRLARRIGFRRIGEATLPHLDADVREALEAFAAGATAGAELGLRRRPHEFALLRSEPTPYEAADAVAVAAMQSFLLASNWDLELARHHVLLADGPEAVAAIDPPGAGWLPVTSPPGTAAGPAASRLAADLALLAGAAGTGGGSNNWALAPGRTAAGRPILANDPHLAPLLPPHWYLCHVSTPQWSAAGASLAGTAGVVAGHNGFAAWGVTAGLIDNTDLFVEEVGPDGASVRRGDGFVPCEIRREIIDVKGAEPVVEEVLVTDHGPIVGPALGDDPGALSIRGTWMQPARARGLLALHRVRSFAEFRAAFRHWAGPPLNVAYADEDGTIGWQLAGTAPRRRRGGGTIPLPAADPAVGWESEPVPFADLPYAECPPEGWIATANNQPVAGDTGPYLGTDWLDGYRVARIGEALADRDDWDVASTLLLQLDVRSLPWRDVRDAVLAATAAEADAAECHSLLSAWDGEMGAGSPAAAVFALFVAEVTRRILAVDAPNSLEWAMGKAVPPLLPHSLFALGRVAQVVELLNTRQWDREARDALAATQARLRSRLGHTPDDWTWGRVRPLTLQHPLGARPPLDRIFNLGPFPIGGDANTVAQASPNPADPAGGTTIAIASLRMAIDVGAWEECRFSLPGGQSGNPLSAHYADQLPLWRVGGGIPIAWDEREVAKATRHTLELLPGE